MSGTLHEPVNDVRPLLNPLITPKNYVDIVKLSDANVSIKRLPSTASGSTLFWQQNSLSSKTFLDRRIPIDFDMSFSLTSVNNRPFAASTNGSALFGLISLRFCPVLMNASNLEIGINNQKTTYTLNRWYEPLSRFNGGDGPESIRLSDQPTFHDYGRYTTSGAVAAGVSPDGCLGTYTDPITAQDGISWLPRGAITAVSITDGLGAHESIIRFKWTEYIYLPPLTDFDDQAGFFDIDAFSISINISTDPSKYLSVKENAFTAQGGITFTPGTTPIYNAGNQFIRLHTVTPPFEKVNYSPVLPAYTIQFVSTVGVPVTNMPPGDFAGASSSTITTNSISLAYIPSKILIFLNRAGEAFNQFDANTYGLITNLKLSYGNQTSYFFDYNQYDLWKQLMWDKGCKVPYAAYQQVGSVFMIEPCDLYGVGSPGTPDSNNLQITATFTNIYPDALAADTTFQFMVILIYDAAVNYSKNNYSINNVVVIGDEVKAKARAEYESIRVTTIPDLNRKASGFKEDVISAISKVVGGVKAAKNFYQNHKDWIDPIINAAKIAGKSALEVALSLFAAGLSENEVYARLGEYYPAVELNNLRRSMKQAGCAGGSTRRKAGALICSDAEFDDDFRPRSRLSLRNRY